MKKKPVDRLTQSAFARKVKAAPSTIQRMANDGRLPTWRDGKIKMPEGLAAYAAAKAAAPANPQNAEQIEGRLALQRAQVRERVAKAEERELRLRRERGELVEVAEVEADARAAAEHIRAQLLALPPRVASQLEALAAGPAGAPRAAAIEALVADEVNRALELLNKVRFGGAK